MEKKVGVKPVLIFLTNASSYRAGMMARGIIRACHENQIAPFWRDYDRFDLGMLGGLPVGVIVWGKLDRVRRICDKIGGKVPIVSTNGNTLDLPIPAVIPDSVAIAESIAGHLVDEGLEKFIFVGWKKNPAARWRAAAFEAAVARRLPRYGFHFFDVEFEDKFWGSEVGSGERLINLLRRESGPLGVVAMNDQAAVSCIECIETAGLKIPRQVAVVGVDDHPLYSNMYLPLTTVRIDYSTIGRTAVEMILARRNGIGDPMERRYIAGTLIVRESSQKRLVGDPQVSRALGHIQANYSTPITLKELCALVGMSRANFAARFEKVVGESPIRYLINFRIERAKVLLSTTPMTVREITFQVGFEDQTYFGRAFKAYTGMSPSEFRQSRGKPARP